MPWFLLPLPWKCHNGFQYFLLRKDQENKAEHDVKLILLWIDLLRLFFFLFSLSNLKHLKKKKKSNWLKACLLPTTWKLVTSDEIRHPCSFFFHTWKWCETMVFKQLNIIQTAVADRLLFILRIVWFPDRLGGTWHSPFLTLILCSVLFSEFC